MIIFKDEKENILVSTNSLTWAPSLGEEVLLYEVIYYIVKVRHIIEKDILEVTLSK